MKKTIKVAMFLLIIGALIMFSLNKNKSKVEQENILNVSEYLFDAIDKGKIFVNETYMKEELRKKVGDEDICNILESINFHSVVICEENVLFVVCEGGLRTVEGYAVVRNDIELAELYPDAGFDEGPKIWYEKISDTLYYFKAPI